MAEPLFTSVIIPVFNAARFLEVCVASVLREAARHPLEAILVDDGSRDGSLAIAHRLAAESGGRVRVLRHEDGGNRGPGATRNVGIRAARGEVILFLDADDLWLPGRLDACLEILAARPEVDGVVEVVGVSVEGPAAAREWGARPLRIPPPDRALARGAAVPFGRVARGESLWMTDGIALRPRLLARTGIFAESPALRVGEDKELWIRLAATGTLVAGEMSRPVATYRRWGASLSAGVDEERAFARVLRSVHAWGRDGALTAARLRLVEERCVRTLLLCGDLGEARRFARSVARPHLPLLSGLALLAREVPLARPLARWWRARREG